MDKGATRKPPDNWIVAHDGTKGEDAYMLECLRCGEKQRVATPISIKAYVASAKAFEKIHKRCQEKDRT